MWDILLNPSVQERRVMRTQAAALGDASLTGHINIYLSDDADDASREAALNSARVRLGELMRETDVR